MMAMSSSPDKEPASEREAAAEALASLDRKTSGAADQSGPVASRFLRNLWSANTVTVTVLAIFLALVVGAILIIVSDPDVRSKYGYFFAKPMDALQASWDKVADAYANLLRGSIVDETIVSKVFNGTLPWERLFFPISETLTYAAPLLFTGLAFAVALRGGLFNIGVQGQAIMGAIGAAVAGFALPLPAVIGMVVAVLAGAILGGAWGFVPGFLKAKTGAHEVITTIMLNYVALFFLSWLIIQGGVHDPARTDAISKSVSDGARLPRLLHFVGPSLRVHLGIFLAVLVTWAVAWLLGRSRYGFEIRAVGLNPDASRTAGINVASTYVLAMGAAGVLAGLGGAMVLLGTALTLTPAVIGQVGFDGLLVGLLGRAKPWGVLLAALLFGALQAGGNRMQSFSGISLELVSVLQALIVIFVAAPALVSAIFRLHPARTGALAGSSTKGW
jgi:ABC-type uncharacterized transport system permease subunit